MKEITISEFRANCLDVIEEVQKTRKPVRITRRGKPIVDILPVSLAVEEKSSDWLGSMKGEMQILGDIVGPASDEDDWEALQNSRSRKR